MSPFIGAIKGEEWRDRTAAKEREGRHVSVRGSVIVPVAKAETRGVLANSAVSMLTT